MPTVFTSQQKASIAQFVAITGADKSTAAKTLKTNGWNIDQAINNHYIATAPVISSAAKSNLAKVFDKYKDADEPNTIGMQGTMDYMDALNVGVEEVGSLVVQEIVQSPSMGEIERDKFITGWGSQGCDTIDKQRAFIKSRIASLAAPQARQIYRSTYKYAFKLFLTTPQQKTIDKATAIESWNLLFRPPALEWRTPNHDFLSYWIEFLQRSSVKGVNADVWDQTLKFAEEVLKDESLAWWDEMASWPGIIDDFIEWLRDSKGVGKKAEATDEMDY